MAGRRLLYALSLTGCLIFYGAYQKWFSWILLLTVLGLPLLSLCLSIVPMLRLKLEPGCADRIPMGTGETLELTAHFPGIHPPLCTKFRVTRPNTAEYWVLKPGAPLPTEHAGGLLIEALRPKVYDHLGLFSIHVRSANPKTVFVMPSEIKMELPYDLNRFLARSWRPKPGGGFAENHEIRNYHPGDNLNQVHWKLSAKTGDLMVRESMEPEHGTMLLTLDINGTPAQLDAKFGRLLWLGNWFCGHALPFEIRALTGEGIDCHTVRDEWDFHRAMDALLCAPQAPDYSIRDREFTAAWRFHIGGAPDEE